MSDWWKISPVCQNCDEYEDCDEPCAMAMSFLQGGNGNNNGYDKF
nr:MAG TPA: NifQ [Caudoviricetes sp.]